MKTLLLVTLLGLTTMLLNCRAEKTDALTADEEMQIEETPNTQIDAFFSAAENFNVEAMREFLDEDIQFAANGNMRMG